MLLKLSFWYAPPQNGTPPQELPSKNLPLFDRNGQRITARWRNYQTLLIVCSSDLGEQLAYQIAHSEHL